MRLLKAKVQVLSSPAGKTTGPKIMASGLSQYMSRPLSLSKLPTPLKGDKLGLVEVQFYEETFANVVPPWLDVCATSSKTGSIYQHCIERRSPFSRLTLSAQCKPGVSVLRRPDVRLGVAGFAVEAKAMDSTAIEEVLTYSVLSMIDCFSATIDSDNVGVDALQVVNHVPVAFGVLSLGAHWICGRV